MVKGSTGANIFPSFFHHGGETALFAEVGLDRFIEQVAAVAVEGIGDEVELGEFSGAMRKLMMRRKSITQKNPPYYATQQADRSSWASDLWTGVLPGPLGYSSLSATMGSMRAARRAGSQLASSEISTMAVVMLPKTTGSLGLTS